MAKKCAPSPALEAFTELKILAEEESPGEKLADVMKAIRLSEHSIAFFTSGGPMPKLGATMLFMDLADQAKWMRDRVHDIDVDLASVPTSRTVWEKSETAKTLELQPSDVDVLLNSGELELCQQPEFNGIYLSSIFRYDLKRKLGSRCRRAGEPLPSVLPN